MKCFMLQTSQSLICILLVKKLPPCGERLGQVCDTVSVCHETKRKLL